MHACIKRPKSRALGPKAAVKAACDLDRLVLFLCLNGLSIRLGLGIREFGFWQGDNEFMLEGGRVECEEYWILDWAKVKCVVISYLRCVGGS